MHYLLNKPAGRGHHGDGHPRPADGGRAGAPRAPGVPRGPARPATEGLLLLTNDGDLAHRLTHPPFGVEKEYLAEVEGRPSRGALRRLREGVDLDDGRTAPARVSLAAPNLYGSPSTRAATARCGGCARPSATRCAGWCGPASGRSPTTGSRRGSGGRSSSTRCAPSSRRRPGPARRYRRSRRTPKVGCAVHASPGPGAPGATTVDDDTAEQITARVRVLMEQLFERNGVAKDDLSA